MATTTSNGLSTLPAILGPLAQAYVTRTLAQRAQGDAGAALGNLLAQTYAALQGGDSSAALAGLHTLLSPALAVQQNAEALAAALLTVQEAQQQVAAAATVQLDATTALDPTRLQAWLVATEARMVADGLLVDLLTRQLDLLG